MKTIETFSGSEAMKEIEPQREGFSLSVALGSLKKWVCGRREKHGKPFGLTNNSAVENLRQLEKNWDCQKQTFVFPLDLSC